MNAELPKAETIRKFSGVQRPAAEVAQHIDRRIPREDTPSTWQLAKLAAILDHNSGQAVPAETAVARAMELWSAARRAHQAEDQRHAILEGLFTMKDPEWRTAIKEFTGDKQRLAGDIESAGQDRHGVADARAAR